MARIVATITQNANGTQSVGTVAEPNAAAAADQTAITAAIALAPSTAALSAAMATLVADGTTPTQAHVTTANNALTAFEAAQTTYNNAVAALSESGVEAALSSDVTILVNTSNVTTKNQIQTAVQKLLGYFVNQTTNFK